MRSQKPVRAAAAAGTRRCRGAAGVSWATLAAALLAGCAAVAPVAAPPAPARSRSLPAPAPTPAPGAAAAVAAAAAAAVADADANADATRQSAFARWLTDFRDHARAAGIDEATLRRALAGVQYLPRVVERDRAQPEFTRAVWSYLDSAVSPQRVAAGRERLARLRADGTAEAAVARHGVPLEIVVAIWGIESNYGSHVGDVPTIAALATLGFDGRRADWAREQLLAALRIVQRGDAEPAQLVGSWAGAIGQTQFLPSNVLAYAVDGDGDGRRDLWGSLPDVVASTAHLLSRVGWRVSEPWGTEVRLPAGFELGAADAERRQPAARWAAAGVQGVDDAPLPAFADASLLLPAGARGPAFLVGANFRALLRYNNATSYALAVGLLAQQLTGGAGVQAAWPRDLQPLSRSESLALQQALTRRGFDSGPADGIVGPATREALRRWQRSAGLPADGYPTVELLQRLQAP